MMRMMNYHLPFLVIILIAYIHNVTGNENKQTKKPNVIILFTDEHNMRTLGCYRELMKDPNVWGKNIYVTTPNIDSLAKDGAILTNFNAVMPLCTPARGAFMTGLYPKFNGAYENHAPLNKDAVTFAQILKEDNYATGFVGKWHLNGSPKPGFKAAEPFGFTYNKYSFNRGHWKFINEVEDDDRNDYNNEINVYEWKEGSKKFDTYSKMRKTYTTDFLFDRALEYMSERMKYDKPYALMMSIPDPHGPNLVRPPYDTMFNGMKFKLPETGKKAIRKNPANPGWAHLETNLPKAEEIIKDIENDDYWQEQMRNYFGMVKLLDDRIGDLLQLIKRKGQEEDTIVIFTSDHGDLLGEHGRYNKGKPYLTSAGTPFVIKYPARIQPKVIETSYTSVDFAPTLLSLMGVKHKHTFHGIDGSEELLNNDETVISKRQIRFVTDSKQDKWVMAIDRRFKLILSGTVPVLFNTKKDPDELINFIDDPDYKEVADRLKEALVEAIPKWKLSQNDNRSIYLDTPYCLDTVNRIPNHPFYVCSDLKEANEVNHEKFCYRNDGTKNYCSTACNVCCEDSTGYIRVDDVSYSCNDFRKIMANSNDREDNFCRFDKVKLFCPVLCSGCEPKPSSQPSLEPTVSSAPSMVPTTSPTVNPSSKPSLEPSGEPSLEPTADPSGEPSLEPTADPSGEPSLEPTADPSGTPSLEPTADPSGEPSLEPTADPSGTPSFEPTADPSGTPSFEPTSDPSGSPSLEPTADPSGSPSLEPTAAPSGEPSLEPTADPSGTPSLEPTADPSGTPSLEPTAQPSGEPSLEPSGEPSLQPSSQPTAHPSGEPSGEPSETPRVMPTAVPSTKPSFLPTSTPTSEPSFVPTVEPSSVPTAEQSLVSSNLI